MSVVISHSFCANFSSLFFFLMIRRPPRSTLFPTRRSSDLRGARHVLHRHRRRGRSAAVLVQGRRAWVRAGPRRSRSEEHTSELQSHSDLVCRLLLEKKKNQSKTPHSSRAQAPRTPQTTALA